MNTRLMLPIALSALIACTNNKPNTEPADKSPGTVPGNAPKSAGGDDTVGCATYAALATKCAGAGEPKPLETGCITSLKSNDATATAMRAQVKCAASSQDCDAYTRCLAAPAAP